MKYELLVRRNLSDLQSLREVAEDIYALFRAMESIAPEMFKGAYFLDSKKKDWQWQEETTKQVLVEELFNLQKGKIKYGYKIKNPTPEHKQVEGYSFTFYLGGDYGRLVYFGGGDTTNTFYFGFAENLINPNEICFDILQKIVGIYKPCLGFIYDPYFQFTLKLSLSKANPNLQINDESRAVWISYFDESYSIPAFDFEVAYRKKELNGEFIKTVEGDFDSNNPAHVEKAMQMVNFLIEHKIISTHTTSK